MRLRVVTLLAVGAALTSAGPASAAEIKLTMSTTSDAHVRELGTGPSGTIGYGWFFTEVPTQVYQATVLADDGQPVLNTCLANGARIELLDADLTIRGGASCTDSRGAWQFILTTTRVTTPTALTAQLLTAATTLDGRPLSPTSSNTIAVLMGPKLVNTSPQRAMGPSFPLSGIVRMPKPRQMGAVVLQRARGTAWVTLATKRTDHSGRFRFSVARGTRGTKTRLRVLYRPRPGTLWVRSSYRYTITWV